MATLRQQLAALQAQNRILRQRAAYAAFAGNTAVVTRKLSPVGPANATLVGAGSMVAGSASTLTLPHAQCGAHVPTNAAVGTPNLAYCQDCRVWVLRVQPAEFPVWLRRRSAAPEKPWALDKQGGTLTVSMSNKRV